MREVIRDCRRAIIRHLDDPTLYSRRVLSLVLQSGAAPEAFRDVLKYVFGCQKSDHRYSFAVVCLLLSGGRDLDETLVEPSARQLGFYRGFRDWIVGCLVRGEQAQLAVNTTIGIVFLSDVLDRAEGHLFSIGRIVEASRVSLLRATNDARLQRRTGTWVLSATFVGAIGHFVYGAAFLTLQNRGRLTRQDIRILSKGSSNNYLRRFFEPYLIPRMPKGTVYAEVMSTRKRHALADGRFATMSELVSEAVGIWASGSPFATVDPETEARGADTLAELGVPHGAQIVTLHVREAGYTRHNARKAGLRDSRISDYRLAIEALADAGVWVVRLGDTSMTPAEPQDGLIDYPFTAAKSDWMDVYLASRCRFHIGTSSGMSFVPLLFGRPVLFTNWITMAHLVCAPHVVTVPKLLVGADGEALPIAAYCGRHGQILERADADLHGLSFRDNAPEDLADAALLMHGHVDAETGQARFPDGMFEAQQSVFAASILRSRPQIAPGFWDRYYAAGAPAARR